MRTFLNSVPRGALSGVPVAAFDTRYPGARWLTGSAAHRVAGALKKKGGRLIVAPESFLMEREAPHGEKRRDHRERLMPGEQERATAWARTLRQATLLVA